MNYLNVSFSSFNVGILHLSVCALTVTKTAEYSLDRVQVVNSACLIFGFIYLRRVLSFGDTWAVSFPTDPQDFKVPLF